MDHETLTMQQVNTAFLRQSLDDSWSDFRSIAQRAEKDTWSDVVITASNEAQADAYRAQIDRRKSRGWLPAQTRFSVIADPDGKRVGSGGATLHLLKILRRQDGGSPFSKRRVLVVHSGGDSQRVPQYSALGKLFSPVPRLLPDGRGSSLFDELMIALAGVPARVPGGMLTLCGDVLLLFSPLQIDLEWSRAACLTVGVPAEMGERHGVFLGDERGFVKAFMHKQPLSSLRECGAVHGDDRVFLDTGAVWLDASLLERLADLVEDDESAARFINEETRLSFYGDFLYPLATDSTLESYLAQDAEYRLTDALLDCRRALWNTLRDTPLRMICLSPAKFIHFGTTKELRRLMLDAQTEYGALGWRRCVLCTGERESSAGVRSLTEPGASIGGGVYMECARVGTKAVIGDGAALSHIDWTTGEIPADTAMHGLPLRGGRYVIRVYGVADNPKSSWRSSVLGNLRDIGADGSVTLWDAPLYAPGANQSEAADNARLLLRLLVDPTDADARAQWTRSARLSLRESFEMADVKRILADEDALEDAIRVERMLDALRCGSTYNLAVSQISRGGPERLRQIRMLAAIARGGAPYPLAMRLNHALYHITHDASFEDRCYDTINRYMFEASAKGLERASIMRMIKREADVTLPARINFGGGWSDTPPYCLMEGGTVLNAAALLGGKRPLRAWARRLDRPIIRLETFDPHAANAEDSVRYHEFDRLDALGRDIDPREQFALGRAILIAAGVIQRGATGLVPVERWGGGLQVGVSSDLPRGSGMGGSSILAAAAIRAVSQLFGLPDDDMSVLERTLLAEQAMATGGGWQDQAGALFPGIKLITSCGGAPQRLHVQPVRLAEAARDELNQRLSLIYTGQRRLARNILRDIAGKVIDADRDSLKILSKIQRLASLMGFELERGNIKGFARLLSRHWELSKALDPGSTNRCIDLLERVCADLIDGAMICGAGGGGFFMVIRKEGVDERTLAARLDVYFQESGVTVWDSCLA
ncbi:MAG: bifunctional fucokinase/L-fucose-1-P-guanylyltransferase [Oscillospiraceae bacterium]|jgi:fucokinase|nr:bifunctional fucokinase/L-fucose-1-P-guanylyltransferase [Oscillospiraceae bacterium]